MEGTAWARARCEPTRSKLSRNIQHPALSQLFDGCHKAPDRFVATTMRHSLLALAALFEQAKSGALSAMAGVGGMDTAPVGARSGDPLPRCSSLGAAPAPRDVRHPWQPDAAVPPHS